MNNITSNRLAIKAISLLLLSFMLVLGMTCSNLAQAENEMTVFTKQGLIDRVDEQSLVIDDCSYLFLPTSLFFKENGDITSRSAFKNQDFVSYQATTKGEIVTLSFAPSKDKPQAKSKGLKAVTSPEPPAIDQPLKPIPKSREIIFENGKWHN